eukprot:350742-Chlamydomonas_euryale.AAC.11
MQRVEELRALEVPKADHQPQALLKAAAAHHVCKSWTANSIGVMGRQTWLYWSGLERVCRASYGATHRQTWRRWLQSRPRRRLRTLTTPSWLTVRRRRCRQHTLQHGAARAPARSAPEKKGPHPARSAPEKKVLDPARSAPEKKGAEPCQISSGKKRGWALPGQLPKKGAGPCQVGSRKKGAGPCQVSSRKKR